MDKASELSLAALEFYLSEVEQNYANILIINASPSSYLHHLTGANLTVVTHNAAHVQLWKSQSDQNTTINPEKLGTYNLVLHLGTKFHAETQACLGLYSQHLAEDGVWITSVHNRLGASHSKKQLKQIFGHTESISKSKCRVIIAQKGENYQRSLANGWAQLNSYTPIKGTQSVAIPGVFSADKIDAGSILLCEYLSQQSWYGTGADFGAGYGYLSQQILKTRHKMRALHLYELDQRGLKAAKQNLGDPDFVHYHWSDVTQNLNVPRPFHWIIMNPPFHTGGDTDIELGLTFIRQAYQHLRPGGKLFIVANLHLPYEALLHDMFRMVKPISERDGFKCFEATK